MNHSEAMQFLKQYFAESLERAKAKIDANGSFSKEKTIRIHKELEYLNELIEDGSDDFGELQGVEEKLEERQSYKQLKPILDRFNLDYSTDSEEYLLLKSLLKYARRNHFQDLLRYSEQVTNYTLLEEKPASHTHSTILSISMKEGIERYLREIEGTITDRSHQEQKDCLKYITDYLGEDFYFNNLGVRQVQDIKDKLQLTPTGRNKGKHTRGKSLFEQIDIATEKELDCLSPTSVNKYLGYFSSLYEWAKRNRLVEENLFKGISIKNSKTANRREMYQKNEISLILKELENNSSGIIKNKSQYWGTLIAIYTGARRNEVGGLMVNDVKQHKETGIWYFDITDEEEEGKSVKTNAGKRLVPIHPKLIELGFMDYLKEAEAIVESSAKHNGMTKRLLYDFTYTKHEKWGKKLGLFVNGRLLKHLNLHMKNKRTLNSLRHSFITYLDIAGIKAETIKSMVGHEQGTVTHGIYTHYGLEHLPQFKEAIEKLDYDVG